MEVNSTIWGAPETWETYDASPITIRIFEGKLPVFDRSKDGTNIDRYDVKSALAASKLSTSEPIDVSPCPWRIKGDSYFLGALHRVAFLPGEGGARYTFKTDPLYDDYTRAMGAPVCLTWGNAPPLPPKMLHYKYIWGSTYDVSGPLYPGDWAPLLDFNYRKICVVPYVVAYDSNRYESVNIPLSTYIANGGVNRYRYLQGLRPRFYVGGAGAWVGVGSFSMRVFGANINSFFVDDYSVYSNEPFLTYGDGVRERVPGATQSNGFTDFSGSDVQNTASASYKAQLDNNTTIFYRAIPEGWFLTDRGAGAFITEYDNFNEDFTVDWIISQFLTLGLWVYTGADISNFDPEHPDEYAYAPLFDAYGTTTGEGVNGAAAAQTPAGSWTNNVQGENIYTGDEPPFDPNQYDEDNATQLPTPSYISGNKLYALNIGEVQGVLADLNDVSANLQSELETVQKFLTNNPIDCIKGCVYFPLDVTEIVSTELNKTDVILGNVITNVEGYLITNRVGIYSMGSCTYYPPDGLDDFRSYEPYSSAELYLPYCGSVKIPPADYIGHKISVKYLIDIETGACLALIYKDDLAIDSIAGQLGVQVPVTGVQTASFAAAQEQAQRNSINAKVATAAAIVGVGAAVFTAGSSLALTAAAVGGAASLTAAASKLEGSTYELEHQQIPYKTVGSAGAATATANEQRVRLVIHRPIMLDSYDPVIYGKTKGFACLITSTLGTFSGFTQVSNADLSGIPATEHEKKMILDLLKSGIYM